MAAKRATFSITSPIYAESLRGVADYLETSKSDPDQPEAVSSQGAGRGGHGDLALMREETYLALKTALLAASHLCVIRKAVDAYLSDYQADAATKEAIRAEINRILRKHGHQVVWARAKE
jgi:hypothetical protein